MESGNVYTKQQRIAELAKQMPEAGFTSLAYYMDLEWMKEAYRRTRKDGATGVDEVTAAQYEEELENNLSSLLERFKSGSYYAPPVRRVFSQARSRWHSAGRVICGVVSASGPSVCGARPCRNWR